MVKNPPANGEDTGDEGSIPPGGGSSNLLQNSSWANPMGRGAWGASVLGVS